MTPIQGKVVWITGASSGIGEALALYLARSGARLILSARRKEVLEEVKARCNVADKEVLVLPLDLANEDQMQACVAEALTYFGRIDWLINNGGISQRSMVADTEMEVYRRLMDINYLGTVALTKAVLPVFLKQGGGQFAVISSLMGKFSSPLRSGYSAAKHALHGFFDALRMEHHEDNIRVTILCPGYVRTNVSKNALTANGAAQGTMDNATDKGMSPEQCAEKIVEAIRRGKYESYIGGKETLAIYLKRFFPNLLHNIVRKAAVT
ncbi:MAG: SDR family oxidoreductase [Bacteroidota bacterium]